MITLFVRKLTPTRKQVLDKIVCFLGLNDRSQIYDLDYFDSKSLGSINYGIAFGEVCARLVAQEVKKLWVLPPLDKLEPSEKNTETRTKALAQMKEIREELLIQEEPHTDWHAILQVGERKICAYSGAKPQVEADVFMSKQDYELLLRLKEAFKAELISIQEVQSAGNDRNS